MKQSETFRPRFGNNPSPLPAFSLRTKQTSRVQMPSRAALQGRPKKNNKGSNAVKTKTIIIAAILAAVPFSSPRAETTFSANVQSTTGDPVLNVFGAIAGALLSSQDSSPTYVTNVYQMPAPAASWDEHERYYERMRAEAVRRHDHDRAREWERRREEARLHWNERRASERRMAGHRAEEHRDVAAHSASSRDESGANTGRHGDRGFEKSSMREGGYRDHRYDWR